MKWKINRCDSNESIYSDHSQIFEAFQFGFGCDTSAEKAGVIVTLQQNARMIHFSHSKSPDSSQTYSIKVDGVDGDFRVNKFDCLISCHFNHSVCVS